MRLNSLTSRLFALLTVLILVGLAFSAKAAKPGATAGQSVGSIGVRVNVPSTIRAYKISVPAPSNEKTRTAVRASTGDLLCLTMNHNRPVSLYVITQRDNGLVRQSVGRWSTNVTLSNNASRDCDVQVPLDLSRTINAQDYPVTLVISPE